MQENGYEMGDGEQTLFSKFYINTRKAVFFRANMNIWKMRVAGGIGEGVHTMHFIGLSPSLQANPLEKSLLFIVYYMKYITIH